LRLETAFKTDKKKMKKKNFIFHHEQKNVLDWKTETHVSEGKQKKNPVADLSATGGQTLRRSDQSIRITAAPLSI
jgi:hypothetical protein